MISSQREWKTVGFGSWNVRNSRAGLRVQHPTSSFVEVQVRPQPINCFNDTDGRSFSRCREIIFNVRNPYQLLLTPAGPSL